MNGVNVERSITSKKKKLTSKLSQFSYQYYQGER